MNRKLRMGIKVIVFVMIFICINDLMAYLTIDDTEQIGRLSFYNLYHTDNINVAVVGASEVYMGIAPEVTYELLEQTEYEQMFVGGANSFL